MDKLHEESRKQFEEWFNEEMAICVTESNATVVRLMLKAWQASRASIAVDIPDSCAVINLCELVFRDDVIGNIRSIGLSIKGDEA